MAIQNRTTTLPGIWASNAQTTIPIPPVAGVTYRDTTLNSTAIDKAWPFKTIVDSSDFNQHAFLQDTLIKEAEQYGIMRWNNTTTYKDGGLCLGQDGKLYQAKRDNQGKDPTASVDDWGEYPELSLYQLKSNLVQVLSQATDKYPSAKAVQDAVNTKQGTITGGATSIVSNNLTASRALVSDGSGKVAVSAVTSTELGYLDGVTSAIQTQLNGKQATITGAATTITSANLTANRALISNGSGKVAVSAVTSTELGYLDGVTSAIQTQLNGKANTALSNISSNIDYIVESGGNDSKWYKKYKSGWIHQGGVVVLAGKTPSVISLLKPMANSSYVICIAGYGTSVSDGTGQLIANVTTTSFSFANNATNANTGNSSWLIIGKAQ